MVFWLIGVDRIAVGRWQRWLCFTEDDCGEGFQCSVPVCLCLCQRRLPVLRPWLAWHLSSSWWCMGYSWHTDLLACCWGMARPLPAVIFSLDGGCCAVEAGCICPVDFLIFISFPGIVSLSLSAPVFEALKTQNEANNLQLFVRSACFIYMQVPVWMIIINPVLGRERNKTMGRKWGWKWKRNCRWRERGCWQMQAGLMRRRGEDKARVVSKWAASPSPTFISRHPPSALPCTLYRRSYTPSLRSPWEQESSLCALEFLLLATEPTC